MLGFSIGQFIRFGSELPISAFHTKRLIRSGLYSIWRHPIYLFYTLLFIGVGIVLQSGAMLCIVLPLFILVELSYVVKEESLLVSRYGEEYKAYRKNTSLLIPDLQSIIRFPCLLFFKTKFHFRIVNRERIPSQPPFFILAAHRNYFDPFFIGVTTMISLYYVTTFEVFRSPMSRFVFRKLHCIPRKRYLADAQATREIITKINEHCAIMIFPEGERSWTGNMGPFKSQVLKLLKHYSSVPIVPIRIDGNYHAWPRWRKWFEQAQVTLTVQEPLLLSQEISIDAMEKQLRSLLGSQDEGVLCSSSARAMGLARLIYRCPVCQTTKPMDDANGISLVCSICQTVYTLSSDFKISYDRESIKIVQSLNDLYNNIRIKQADIKPSDAVLEPGQQPVLQEGEWIIARGKDCHYSIETGRKMKEVANGDLILSNRHLFLFRTEGSLFIELDSIISATIESNDKLQLYQERWNKLHQLTFEHESVLKWQDYICETIRAQQGRTINRT
jgi:1-acyl-sn-glycerol-3-phosphate acyltransferase